MGNELKNNELLAEMFPILEVFHGVASVLPFDERDKGAVFVEHQLHRTHLSVPVKVEVRQKLIRFDVLDVDFIRIVCDYCVRNKKFPRHWYFCFRKFYR